MEAGDAPAGVRSRATSALQMLTMNSADNQAMAATAAVVALSHAVAELLPCPQQPSSRVPHRDSGLVSNSTVASSTTFPLSTPRQPLHPGVQATAMTSAQSLPDRQQQPDQQPSRAPPHRERACWSCGATGVPLKKCSVCAVASYCGAACQKVDWGVHKAQCAGLKAEAASWCAHAGVRAVPGSSLRAVGAHGSKGNSLRLISNPMFLDSLSYAIHHRRSDDRVHTCPSTLALFPPRHSSGLQARSERARSSVAGSCVTCW